MADAQGTDYDAIVTQMLPLLASADIGDMAAALEPWLEGVDKENAFCKAVQDRDLGEVERMLAEGQSPNSSSDFDYSYMSALERAVVTYNPPG